MTGTGAGIGSRSREGIEPGEWAAGGDQYARPLWRSYRTGPAGAGSGRLVIFVVADPLVLRLCRGTIAMAIVNRAQEHRRASGLGCVGCRAKLG